MDDSNFTVLDFDEATENSEVDASLPNDSINFEQLIQDTANIVNEIAGVGTVPSTTEVPMNPEEKQEEVSTTQ